VRLAQQLIGFGFSGFCFPGFKCHDICPQ
jgi:hypothetical protein